MKRLLFLWLFINFLFLNIKYLINFKNIKYLSNDFFLFIVFLRGMDVNKVIFKFGF